jgi:hypothetical protein
MKVIVEKEIRELHQFFTDWYNGTVEDDAENFARFEQVIAPSFRLISPDGINHHYAPLTKKIKEDHGSRPGMQIEIKSVVLRFHSPEYTFATYEEWQHTEGKNTSRISSVIFHANPDCPNGLEWVHVHETWRSA